MKVVIAEKPSVARELAAFLGATARREGYYEGKGYQVTWALGHLATLKEPHDYDPNLKRWSLETLPFVPDRFGLKVIEDRGARQQFEVIRRLFRTADALVCATDAGREGELIFRYILDLTGCGAKPAQRLWLSSLTESAIREAFARLRPLSDYDTLFAAARCRSEADWVVGLNATRYYTVRYRTPGLLWSVGRVQTPVLAMIVRRDDEIRTFKPEPFWEVITRYRAVMFKFAGSRFVKEEEARAILEQVQGQPFTIRGIDRKPERVPPPQLYDLTDLQRDMNRRYGMSADATLKTAQALYEAKLLSYPRTDSRYLGTDMKAKVPAILAELRNLKPEEIGKLDLQALAFTGRIINDQKVSDHHAIIPTGKVPGDLAPAGRKVFDAVVTRFIAAFYPTCLKEVTTISGLSNTVPFRARGVRIVDPGWTVLYPRNQDDKDKKEEDQELPEFRSGESGPHEPSVKRGETTPPKSYTEGSLLGAMETAGKFVDDEELKEALKERGLGTPATRASIIETLLARGYINRDKKTLAATDLGRYLIALIQVRGLKSPELTGEWEAKLREIERGRLDARIFMDEIAHYTGEVIRSGDETAIDLDRLGDCPRCGRPVIVGKKGYGCSGWKDGCKFVLWREFQDRTLGENEVRQLLQRRVLFGSGGATGAGSGGVIVHLTDTGELTAIPIPAGKPRQSAQANRRPPSPRKPKGPGRREAVPGKSAKSPARKDKSSFASVSLGSCPLCGAEVAEQEKGYRCADPKGACRFTIWKQIAGKTIGIRAVQALLKQGRTAVLKGFKSKAGKRFEARLKIDGGEVRFDFEK